LFSVQAEKELGEINRTDLIIIPALFGDMSSEIELNKNLIPWIIRQREKGAD